MLSLALEAPVVELGNIYNNIIDSSSTKVDPGVVELLNQMKNSTASPEEVIFAHHGINQYCLVKLYLILLMCSCGSSIDVGRVFGSGPVGIAAPGSEY